MVSKGTFTFIHINILHIVRESLEININIIIIIIIIIIMMIILSRLEAFVTD